MVVGESTRIDDVLELEQLTRSSLSLSTMLLAYSGVWNLRGNPSCSHTLLHGLIRINHIHGGMSNTACHTAVKAIIVEPELCVERSVSFQ